MLKIVGIIMVVAVAALAGGAYKLGFIMNDSPTEPVAAKSVYEFTMRDIDGKNVKLDAYKGKVVMIVNTASKCGYTPQYEGLQALYDKNKDKGFVVLGFPANNFKEQEPGSNEDIKAFCTKNYGVTFPMAEKISVKGKDMAPIYQWLTQKEKNGVLDAQITWNFNKFLLDENGKLITWFPSNVTPLSEEIVSKL